MLRAGLASSAIRTCATSSTEYLRLALRRASGIHAVNSDRQVHPNALSPFAMDHTISLFITARATTNAKHHEFWNEKIPPSYQARENWKWSKGDAPNTRVQ